MLSTPAMKKIRETPRKYHFFPSQSIFVVRNSSKLTPKPSAEPTGPAISRNLNRQRCAALFPLQNCVKDHTRNQNRSKQVGKQTEREGHSKSAHGPGTEQKQDHRRDDRRNG